VQTTVSEKWQQLFANPVPWAAVTFTVVVSTGLTTGRPLFADSVDYRLMAMGMSKNVMSSISGRILHPAAVRLVSWLTKVGVDQAFVIVALISLAVLLCNLALILRLVTGYGSLTLPLLATPVVIHSMFRLYYCQDLFYAALLSGMFVALLKGQKVLATGLLLPLSLTRESTILLTIVWAFILFQESSILLSLVSIVLTGVGLACSRSLAATGVPNVHHVSELLFLALKPPFDLLRNLFGIILVPSEMKGKPGFTCTAKIILDLPEVLRYGGTSQVGVCRPQATEPIRNATLLLSLFGIGPACAWRIFSEGGRGTLAQTPYWLRLATLYGLLALFIAPGVSFWLVRDIGYSWPLFWIAIPALVVKRGMITSYVVALLLVENLVACWIPYALDSRWHEQQASVMLALATAFAMQIVALYTLRKRTGVAAS